MSDDTVIGLLLSLLAAGDCYWDVTLALRRALRKDRFHDVQAL